MKMSLAPGKYIAAVSGGVDSAVLLFLLQDLPDIEPVVAHFDHRIREDSERDRQFVQTLARRYDLPFEYEEGRLGPETSEAAARAARYRFLQAAMKKHKAKAIITAHHQDDVLETAIINILRGTGRKGLSALDSRDELARPLLDVSKQEILQYAKAHNLKWREDSSNQDEVYLRNYVRRRLLPRFSAADKKRLLDHIGQSRITNRKLDRLLEAELSRYADGANLNKLWFNRLPHDVSLEIMASWLRRQKIRNFDRKTLDRLVVAAKTGRPGQRFDVINGSIMMVATDSLALAPAER